MKTTNLTIPEKKKIIISRLTLLVKHLRGLKEKEIKVNGNLWSKAGLITKTYKKIHEVRQSEIPA